MQIDLARLTNGQRNAAFLEAISPNLRKDILGTIATHYGTDPETILSEVTDPDSEHLLDYMTEPHRGATKVIMDRHGLTGF